MTLQIVSADRFFLFMSDKISQVDECTLIAAFSRISVSGACPKVAALYPDVEFPVPRGTASLAQLVSWQTDESTLCDSFLTLKVAVSEYLIVDTNNSRWTCESSLMVRLLDALSKTCL